VYQDGLIRCKHANFCQTLFLTSMHQGIAVVIQWSDGTGELS
jgi:hypothetical protein